MTLVRATTLAIATVACLTIAHPARMSAQQTQGELEQLVAPVALYPDELLAEVLAASTYPTDVDDAATWLRSNATMNADQLASSVDGMPWDDSVKALTEFPLVLDDMERNLSWTSALGDAYYNQPDDVMDAVQTLRARAIAAGTLQSNSQITVTRDGNLIVIEPAQQDTVYVPEYDAWADYGAPIDPWPDYVFASNIIRGPRVIWSPGFHVTGLWGRSNWGWHNWGLDWNRRQVLFRRFNYVSRSPAVINRHYPARSNMPPRGNVAPRPGDVRTEPNRFPPSPGRVEPGRTQPGRPIEPGRVTEPNRSAGPGRSTEPGRTPGRATEPGRSTEPGRGRGEPPAGPVPGARTPPNQSRTNRGFPPAPAATPPPPPPTGTHSGAMTGVGRGGGDVSQNSSRGRSSMGEPRPQPPPNPGRSGPPPSTAAPARSGPPPQSQPPKGRGRGRS
jgi:hypothetical protein